MAYMILRNTRKLTSLSNIVAGLAIAVPGVVAHRMTQMAVAGTAPTKRDKDEFQRMYAEKSAAFGASWNAMGAAAMGFWSPALLTGNPATAAMRVHNTALGVMTKSMAPVWRTAMANAQRLGRPRHK